MDTAGTTGLEGYLLPAEKNPLHDVTAANAYSAWVPHHHHSKHINMKEILAVLKAIQLWGPQLTGQCLHLFINNTAVVGGIAKHTMKGPAMAPLRKILLVAARWDLELAPRWIPTNENALADALSHQEWRKLAAMALQLSQ
jgi:hypothetical protein